MKDDSLQMRHRSYKWAGALLPLFWGLVFHFSFKMKSNPSKWTDQIFKQIYTQTNAEILIRMFLKKIQFLGERRFWKAEFSEALSHEIGGTLQIYIPCRTEALAVGLAQCHG